MMTGFATAGGCAGLSNTDKGLLAGGGLGSVAGAAIGSRSGNTGAGAAIGGLMGAAVGGLTGASMDATERRQEAREVSARQRLTLEDIVRLTGSGASDTVIIGQIRSSGAVYHLTPEEMHYLVQSGVRDPIIQELQSTGHRHGRSVPAGPPQRVVYVPEPAPVRPVYVVPPPPPPPVGFGVTFIRQR